MDGPTFVPTPPLVCELIFGDLLETHVDEFHSFVTLIGELTMEALLRSETIEACDEVFDRRRWEGAIGTGLLPEVKMKFRKLTRRGWANALAADDLRGFDVGLRPLPNVSEMTGLDSWISLSSQWHRGVPNWVSVRLPGRYLAGLDAEWAARLSAAFTSLGVSAGAMVGCLGRMSATEFMRYRVLDTDWRRQLWLSGWAMLLGDGHLERLDGLAAVEATGLFRGVGPVSDADGATALYYLESRDDLFAVAPEQKPSYRAELDAFLDPILLPPPFNPAQALHPET